MYPIGKALPILLITLLVRTSALIVNRKGADESTLKNASNLNDTAFSFTREVLLAWTHDNNVTRVAKKPLVHDKPKLSPTEAGSLNNGALAPTPVHEQKRQLRSGMDARNATGADQASLVEPASPILDAFSAYRSAYDGSLSIELTESQIDEANASRTGHPPPPFNTTQGNHSANEKARVLGPLLKDVEQKQGFIAVCFAVAALILSSC